jgi:hypothetical protein
VFWVVEFDVMFFDVFVGVFGVVVLFVPSADPRLG